ncbi:MAG: hypothetical protein AB7G93_13340 [Bdellovibrionales bacterium]
MEKYFDVCDQCGSRELDFIFFDLRCERGDTWIKDIPGYRCRDCGEILVSSGAVDTIDEISLKPSAVIGFPILKYQKRVLKGSGLERDINERMLHAWSIVQRDGRLHLHVMGSRTFGDLKNLAI